MSGFGVAAQARPLLEIVDGTDGAPWSSDGHRHGRWVGLFKLGEEIGEAITAVTSALAFGDQRADPGDDSVGAANALLAAIEDEFGDVLAAARHVADANGLRAGRIEARQMRRASIIPDDARGAQLWFLMRAGEATQLLGKIGPFPHGTEHPDGAGNLPARLEVALGDISVAICNLMTVLKLDAGRVSARIDTKLALFRTWFPATVQS